MLYKVGGLLYMDRSRQAVRKCIDPLISKDGNKIQPKLRRSNRRISGLLKSAKSNIAPVKLSLFSEENAENVPVKQENICVMKSEINVKVNEELERMKSVLASSCKILNNLSADENVIKKLKISNRLKRKGVQCKNFDAKKLKQEPITDENYDINTLLSFDKNVGKNGDVNHFPTVSTERFSFNVVPQSNFPDGQNPENLNNISNIMDNISYNVFLNTDNTAATNYNENDTAQLLQTFKDLENEICNTVGTNMPNLYPAQALPQEANSTYIDYINTSAVPSRVEFKENCENEFKVIDSDIPNFDENIAKNYSLIEEYCKSIATDELFLDDKTTFEFYENGELANGAAKSARSNEIIVVNENVFNTNERSAENRTSNDGGLNFDPHILNTYLSSISGESNTQNITDMNFAARQFDLAQVVEPQENQTLTKENVYDEIMTLNKQFQGKFSISLELLWKFLLINWFLYVADNTAVKIDQPSTPTAVYAKAENEEVLKWLF